MRARFVVGTAGHVDHGKSALVIALTGIDPDRWDEERRRGMTIDLGFAPLDLGDGTRAALVDVPGHERFVHNMLAGAVGIDALLLVVAANEGVKAQTLEHLAILRHLDVRALAVVVTKCDLFGPEELAQRCTAITEHLRGTIAQGAPIACVSNLTGAGIDDLRLRIAAMLSELIPRDASAPALMPIDRAFTLPGAGTIVTGTLLQGHIERDQTLVVRPGERTARIRRIEVFGEVVDRVDAGTRVALNLPGIDRRSLGRGDTIADAVLVERDGARVRFVPEAGALGGLRRRMPVRVHVGSAEILGTLVFDRLPDGPDAIDADLHLRHSTVLIPGQRGIVRRVSPKELLGGIEVVGNAVGAARLEGDAVQAAILGALAERGAEGADIHAVAAAINVREEIALIALRELQERGDALALARPPGFLAAASARDLLKRSLDILEAVHAAEPWSLGLTSIALARALPLPEAVLARAAAALTADGALAYRGGYYAVPGHRPLIAPEQRAFLERLLPVDPERPFVPVPLAEVKGAIASAGIVGAAKALETMLVQGAVVNVHGELYRGTQIAQIRARVEQYLHAHAGMTAAAFRDLIGTSRKYAVPLLEWLDAAGLTVRDGDERRLRGGA